jgi:hypothetical protein
VIRALPLLLSLALTIWCLIDCVQTASRDVRYLPKIGWIVVIVLFWVIGPIAWLLAGRPRQAPSGGIQGGRRPQPLAPDDDPDFLRRLDWERWRRQRGDETGGPDPGPLPQ